MGGEYMMMLVRVGRYGWSSEIQQCVVRRATAAVPLRIQGTELITNPG
jgi:hypothetical protein